MTELTPPDILRCAYLELVVSDLAASRAFYVDVLGLVVTAEDENAIYLRTLEEFIHHNLMLRRGPVPAAAALAFRVRAPEDVDRAEAYYRALGCRTERRKDGFVEGIGDAVRVTDPLGFPYEFFHEVQHVERLSWHFELYTPGALVRARGARARVPPLPSGQRCIETVVLSPSADSSTCGCPGFSNTSKPASSTWPVS